MIYNAIIILKINQNYSQIIIGVVIIIAVILDRINTALLKKRIVARGPAGEKTHATAEA